MKNSEIPARVVPKEESLREFINQALHNPRTRSSRIINGFLVFLIIVSVAVVPLHFMKSLEEVQKPLFFFDKIVVTIFTIEYILRIWSAKKPIRYVTSPWGIIDFIAILPFYLARFGLFTAPEIFLLLRIFRLLKLGRAYEMERVAIANCAEDSHGEFHVVPGEKIERVVQKHPIILLMLLIIPLLLTSAGLFALIFFEFSIFAIIVASLFMFFAIVFFIKAWLDYNYDVIYITNRRVIFQNRELFGAITNEVSYEAITNVVPNNTGIIHWLFGFGDIQIETASSVGIIHFYDAPEPHDVVRHISRNRQIAFEAKTGGRMDRLLKEKEKEMENREVNPQSLKNSPA